MSKEFKPIQAKIVGCDFKPEGYPEGAITIECLTSGEVEVCAENVMIISRKHYKELIAAYEKLKED